MDNTKKLLLIRDDIYNGDKYINELKNFEKIKFLPSFILRTFYDGYINKRTNLSHYQRYILDTWKKHGLGRKQALEQISKFARQGQKILPYINEEYFKIDVNKLDSKLLMT